MTPLTEHLGVADRSEHMRRTPPREVQKYFASKPESVGSARRFTTATLVAWGLEESGDDVELCVSELASNAVVHGAEPGHGFLVKLVADDISVRLEVHDDHGAGRGDSRPHVRHPAASDDSGRGLLLVELLAEDWGVEARHPLGKAVWSRFPTSLGRSAPPVPPPAVPGAVRAHG
ncbi:ATP-binding protein [Streptomyces cucumeris]|uniref:ATP-binding protein n=1 Tax=Streptomyces cucumeris TaxID=2962890 RepID=UPI003D72AE9A